METVFIVNPEASSSEEFIELLSAATERDDLRPKTSRHPGHARELTGEALDEGVDRLVVVGGDGTINEVVNGLGDERGSVELGILPAGTGNDIARSLDLPLSPRAALEVVLDGGRVRTVDLMRARWNGGEKLALNVINGGYAGELADDVTHEMKERFGPLAYLAAAPQAWTDTAPCETRLEWADGTVEVIDAVALIIANGHTLGGGFRISPDNDLSAGQFGVFAIQPGTLLNLAGIATRLASGNLAESPHIVHRPTSHLRATTRPQMGFTTDGERIDEEVTDVEILPNALRVLVPPPDGLNND